MAERISKSMEEEDPLVGDQKKETAEEVTSDEKEKHEREWERVRRLLYEEVENPIYRVIRD